MCSIRPYLTRTNLKLTTRQSGTRYHRMMAPRICAIHMTHVRGGSNSKNDQSPSFLRRIYVICTFKQKKLCLLTCVNVLINNYT